MSLKLYLGTTTHEAREALRKGFPSISEHYRVTDTYGPHFANTATALNANAEEPLGDFGERYTMAVVELHNNEALRSRLLPDLDFITQVSAEDKHFKKRMEKIGSDRRQKWLWRQVHEHRELWPKSISMFGVAHYHGKLPPELIKRVALVSLNLLPWVAYYAAKVSLTLLDHQKQGWRQRNLTDWIFGETLTLEDWLGVPPATCSPQDIANAERLLGDRSGIKIIEVNPPHVSPSEIKPSTNT